MRLNFEQLAKVQLAPNVMKPLDVLCGTNDWQRQPVSTCVAAKLADFRAWTQA